MNKILRKISQIQVKKLTSQGINYLTKTIKTLDDNYEKCNKNSLIDDSKLSPPFYSPSG